MSSIHKKGEFTKIFLITFKLLRQCFRLFFKIFTSLILYWAWTWPYLTFWPLSFLDFWVIKNGMHEIDWARVDWDRSTDEIQYRPVPNVAPFTFLIRGDSQIHIKNTVLRTLYYDNNEPMTSSLPYVSTRERTPYLSNTSWILGSQLWTYLGLGSTFILSKMVQDWTQKYYFLLIKNFVWCFPKVESFIDQTFLNVIK